MQPTRPPPKTVLVTGATGYLGTALSHAFSRAGYHVHGLVRNTNAASALLAAEITPLIGTIGPDLAFLTALLAREETRPFDVVVSCTEQIPFDAHWAHVLALLTLVAHHAREKGAGKPLVLVTSGCKDYGFTPRHGEAGLAPHGEDAPLRPVDLLRARAFSVLQAFGYKELFDAVVVRPTPLFGYGGSYYGVLFDVLGRVLREGVQGAVQVPGHPDNIYHGCHVDDCAKAYVALAAHPVRAEVSGECFNISGYRYETVSEILAALAAEYGVEGGIAVAPVAEVRPELRALDPVLGYSQWVGSEKIRRLTGWEDKRALFSENVGAYRLAYEAAAKAGDEGVARIRDRVAGWVAAGIEFQKTQAESTT
ncbi:NAD(P)-binding protein [Hypoxylon argillaceum]|nr:NAD(P)-binding protein [Hypoxylon argillaceum]